MWGESPLGFRVALSFDDLSTKAKVCRGVAIYFDNYVGKSEIVNCIITPTSWTLSHGIFWTLLSGAVKA